MSTVNNKRLSQYIQNAERIYTQYDGIESLSRFLTRYFKANKQMGSKDRRIASRFIYNYFRLGQSLIDLSFSERLVVADWLCSQDTTLAEWYGPDLAKLTERPLAEKLAYLEKHKNFKLEDVFPCYEQLSPSIEGYSFALSFFVQPDLFIRVRTGKEAQVIRHLEKSEIPFRKIGTYTLALPNGTGLDKITDLRGLFEVQDLSSQQTFNFFEAQPKENWWDACAGSGGKSLLLKDYIPSINLLVSDTRTSILRNLDERFELAGIRDYRKKIIDLTKSTEPILGSADFDGIILDAPCSGSGTWGRTPETLSYFDPNRIAFFSSLQKQIVTQVSKHIKPEKPLIYITCSAFEAENEAVVQFMEDECGLRLERMSILHGYQNSADTMFVARMTK